MATTYTVQTPPHAGATLAATAPSASGDVLPCGSGLALLVVNTGANTPTVSLPLPNSDGQAVTARTFAIPTGAGSSVLIPLPAGVYGATVSPTWTGTLTGINTYVISNGN